MLSSSEALQSTFFVQADPRGAQFTIGGTIARSGFHYVLQMYLADAGGSRLAEIDLEYGDIIEVYAFIPYLSRQLAGAVDPVLLAGNVKPGTGAPSFAAPTVPMAAAPTAPVPRRPSSRTAPTAEPTPEEPEEPALGFFARRRQQAAERPPRSPEEADEAWKNKRFYTGLFLGSSLPGKLGAFPEYPYWEGSGKFIFDVFFDWQISKLLAFRATMGKEGFYLSNYDSGQEYSFSEGSFTIAAGANLSLRPGNFDLATFVGIKYFVIPDDQGNFIDQGGTQRRHPSLWALTLNPQVGVKLGPGVLFVDYRANFEVNLHDENYPDTIASSGLGIGYKMGFGTRD
jgi:hypothetical protein